MPATLFPIPKRSDTDPKLSGELLLGEAVTLSVSNYIGDQGSGICAGLAERMGRIPRLYAVGLNGRAGVWVWRLRLRSGCRGLPAACSSQIGSQLCLRHAREGLMHLCDKAAEPVVVCHGLDLPLAARGLPRCSNQSMAGAV